MAVGQRVFVRQGSPELSSRMTALGNLFPEILIGMLFVVIN